MDSLDYWRLCDELTIKQAALLVVGEDPSGTNSDVENLEEHKRPDGYEAAKAAISNALRRDAIEGKIIPVYLFDQYGVQCGVIEDSLDAGASRVEVESLRTWLIGRGFRTGFFFPPATDIPSYLDPLHTRYAPKLAAAVNAWVAMEDEALLKGKTPKQALMRWLRENAANYKLSDEEGKPNELGIEECAKVANWQDKGGAPKTPNK